MTQGVHETHCCVQHGCKYGDEDCPVITGTARQQYPCEQCMEPDAPAFLAYIRRLTHDWTDAAPEWRRTNEFLRTQEREPMTPAEIAVWELVYGMKFNEFQAFLKDAKERKDST